MNECQLHKWAKKNQKTINESKKGTIRMPSRWMRNKNSVSFQFSSIDNHDGKANRIEIIFILRFGAIRMLILIIN